MAFLENKKASRKHPALKLLQTEEFDFNINISNLNEADGSFNNNENIPNLEEVRQDQDICRIENIPILMSDALPTIELPMTGIHFICLLRLLYLIINY